MRSRHSTSRTVWPSSSSGTVTTPDMTTALLSHHYDPSLNHAAPLSRQNCQPRRSEAEPRWLLRPEKGPGLRLVGRGVCWVLLLGQGCDLDEVVGEDAVAAPDRGSVPAV